MSEKKYKAIMRFVRISPYKVRDVANSVRGTTVANAISLLRQLPHRGARLIEKVLLSAAANAEDLGERQVDKLYVVGLSINSGPTMKRIQPHARGMGFPILKRTSHIEVQLSTSDKA